MRVSTERERTLEELLLPGTPERVERRYRTLAERAEQTSFGLLEEDVVMLDTETTGLSFRNNELIEIAAARISGREVVKRFQTFVHPTGNIPAEIQVLTGINDLDVSNAPRAEEAVAALADFVGGMPVVAHNASFDRTFIERVPGGRDVSDTWIDSLALSRIALPRLSSHRLADMASAFGCSSVTHRAMADVDALCGMWRILLLALSDLPVGLLGHLADMHADVPWSYRVILANLATQDTGATFSLRGVRADLVGSDMRSRKKDANDVFITPDCGPSAREVEAAFGEDGVVSRMYEAYERRDQQRVMAEEVRSAFVEGTHRAVEAGTGVGKSMAYLVPAVLFAQENNVTVGVATKTNALTDQLVSQELPALAQALPGGLSFCSVKGYDHYPCLRRLELASVRELPVDVVEHDGQSDSAVAADMLTAIAVTYAFVCQSCDGDLDALGIRWRHVPRSLLTTTSADCMKTRCPFYPHACLVHGNRQRASRSDVVVTNHSLLLRDVALDGALLPPIRHWVVDEAHSFEQEARRQWAHEFASESVQTTFATLGGISSGVLHGLYVRSAELDAAELVARLITKAAAAVQRASVSSASLVADIHGLVAVAGRSGGYDNLTLWIGDDVRATDEWAAIERASAQAADQLEQAAKALDEAREAIAAESTQMASELSDAVRSLRTLLEAIKIIVLEPTEEYVYSAELSRAKRRTRRERLVAERLDVGATLAERWYPEIRSVVYTSATIAVGKSFEHFDHAVGFDLLPPETHRSVRLNSSFDYENHMSVVVARDMPAPQSREYLDALENLLFDVHVSMGGSVLTLFTNRREMERVYTGLSPRLAQVGLDLACQERGTSPRRLRERFMSEETLSLCALKSFWEGFDAAGDTLRCVVIPKLPFASPQDPLVREREAREDRSWWRYSLPEAVLSVKQAAGRLIRTSSDTGVLVIADSRVSTKRYGKTFLNALPQPDHVDMSCENVGRYIDLWRGSRR